MIRPEIKILPHQISGIGFMLKHNYCINADQQGLGKTIESIAVQQAEDSNCLIIVPATAKFGWKDEYHKFTDEKDADVVVGYKKAKINIVNYENIYKCTELFMNADTVIIDEAHYLIHLDSQRTNYAHRMVKKYKPNRLILLTGTPVKNRVTDFYSLLLLMSYSPIKNNGRLITDKFKTQLQFNTFFSITDRFKIRVKGRGGKYFQKEIVKHSGIKNEDILKVYMRFKLIRRLASKVLDLPPMIFKDVVVSYKRDPILEDEFQKYVKGEAYDTKVKSNSAASVAPFTADYVRDIIKSGEGPVIVFSDHLNPLDIIESKLRKNRFKMAKITGKVKAEDRHKYIKQFQAGELDLILCSVGAASTNITLTRSRNMVLNDPTWDLAAMSQLLKRFHRIGQTRKCVVHKMHGSKVARKISDSLAEKQANIDKIL